jgi:DNA-binding LacI/PurR family transcriptional regulator
MDVSAHAGGHPPYDGKGDGPGSRDAGGAAPSLNIYDVAAAAGVSYQTISRVINGSPNVSRSTREHVLATITRLGYRPNRMATALARGTVQAVTVLASNTTLYGQRSVIQGIEEAARAADFAMGVRVIESEQPAAVRDAVDRSTERGGALIVVAFDRAGTLALGAVPSGVPMVGIVETPTGGEGDDRRAAAEATEYLLGLGHRTVHYVSIPPTSDATPTRLAGWKSALERAHVTAPEPIPADWHPRSGYEAGRTLAADLAVTAVLCGNDDLALGVIRAMREAGRDVPGSVSVVGFDDIPQAEFLTPALTTVRLDFNELGRASFALLQEQTGAVPANRPRPGPELIVRESSGQPRLPAGPVQAEVRGQPHQLQREQRQPEQQQRRVDPGEDGGTGDLDEEEGSGDEEVPDREADAQRPELSRRAARRTPRREQEHVTEGARGNEQRHGAESEREPAGGARAGREVPHLEHAEDGRRERHADQHRPRRQLGPETGKELPHHLVFPVTPPPVQRERRRAYRGGQRDDRQREDEQQQVEGEEVEERGERGHDPCSEYAGHKLHPFVPVRAIPWMNVR